MSQGAFEQTKESRRLCQACRGRKARFRHRGFVKADRELTHLRAVADRPR